MAFNCGKWYKGPRTPIFCLSTIRYWLLFAKARTKFVPQCRITFFCEVVYLGSSLVYSMNSGAPGIYLRKTSGTTTPYRNKWVQYSLVKANPAYSLRLVILQHTAQSSLGSTQGRVQRMDILLLDVCRSLGAIPNIQGSRLIVGTIGTRHELFVLLLIWKPSFKIILLRSGVVESTRHYGDHLIGNS